MTTANKEQYLECICRLGEGDKPVALSAVADEMGIAAVSVSEMVKKLAALALVTYEPYKGARLTPTGRTEALRLIRRHRLWERFLTDHLALPWEQVHEEACRLEHATSARVEKHLARFLGEPPACPHGHPMPTVDGELEIEPGLPMADLGAGECAEILRVPEGDTALLQYLADLGMAPRATVCLHSAAPFGGPLTVAVAGTDRVVGRDLAARIAVRRLPPLPECLDE